MGSRCKIEDMKYLVIIILILCLSCKENKQASEFEEKVTQKVVFDKELSAKLAVMVEVDQYYAGIPQGKHEGDWDRWMKIRDSINKIHQRFLKEVIDTSGYPGHDRIGEDGESNFWVMVQHSDFDPVWQGEVLALLKEQVKANNATPSHVGLLEDRVRVNTGRPQLYGTQRHFNELGQAYIKDLEDRNQVNERRATLGMETLEAYLNDATLFHFEMNKEYLATQGITEPTLYPIPEE